MNLNLDKNNVFENTSTVCFALSEHKVKTCDAVYKSLHNTRFR